jgi:glutaredoxin
MRFVKMYSADWCFDCKNVVQFFEKNNVAYQLINVDHDHTAVETLKKLCDGKRIVPTLEVEGNILINPSLDELTAYFNPVV